MIVFFFCTVEENDKITGIMLEGSVGSVKERGMLGWSRRKRFPGRGGAFRSMSWLSRGCPVAVVAVSYTHSEPTRLRRISYAVFCLKKKNTTATLAIILSRILLQHKHKSQLYAPAQLYYSAILPDHYT